MSTQMTVTPSEEYEQLRRQATKCDCCHKEPAVRAYEFRRRLPGGKFGPAEGRVEMCLRCQVLRIGDYYPMDAGPAESLFAIHEYAKMHLFESLIGDCYSMDVEGTVKYLERTFRGKRPRSIRRILDRAREGVVSYKLLTTRVKNIGPKQRTGEDRPKSLWARVVDIFKAGCSNVEAMAEAALQRDNIYTRWFGIILVALIVTFVGFQGLRAWMGM